MKNDQPLHIPVLLQDVLRHIPKPDENNFSLGMDATFGRGGHALAVLNEFPKYKIVGLDRDEEALAYGQSSFKEFLETGRLQLIHDNYVNCESYYPKISSKWGDRHFRYILLDLGVSSPQLDSPERGFSFYHDGPLDMRMDHREGLNASDIVNDWSEEELIEVFRGLGEVNRPGRVVRAIIEDRKSKPFASTLQLSDLIARVEGWRKKGHHPATKYFMGLRLQVNQELPQVEQAIEKLVDLLEDGGRLLVITFHSTEDRIVKYKLKDLLDKGFLVNKKVIQSGRDEQLENPRSRSAKLRVFQKGQNEKKLKKY